MSKRLILYKVHGGFQRLTWVEGKKPARKWAKALRAKGCKDIRIFKVKECT